MLLIVLSGIMEYYDGFKFREKLRKKGESYYLLVSSDMIEYLGLETDKDGEYLVACKADKGKWGNFLGFGKVSKKVKW